MKRIIIVVGNMGSGKSTFCRALAEKLPGYVYVCLDDERKKNFADVLTQRHDPLVFEKEVAEKTRREFKKHSQILYETTGATRFFKDMHYALVSERYNIYIVQIRCNPDTCLTRHRDREKKGHFHIVPQYGKGLTAEELINRYADKTGWIRPDLVLDSEQLDTWQMVRKFWQAYFPSDSESQLKEIIQNFDYKMALDWFVENVPGKTFVKEILSTGEDDFNRLNLKKELNEYKTQLESTPTPIQPTDQSDSISLNLPQSHSAEESEASTYSEPTREEWSPMYREANYLFMQLDHEKDDETRKKKVFKILDLMDEVQELWDRADFIKKHGEQPQHAKAGMDQLSDAQKSTRIRTLRTYISKAKKGILNADRIPQWENEMSDLEKILL